MSKNEPNWVGGANLASNILQNIQLQELHSTLRTLGAIQAEQVRYQLNERQKTEREDRMREGLWQMENALGNLVRDAVVTPSAMVIMAREVQTTMARFGLATGAFRKFEDKDRLGRFVERLQKTEEESARKMSDREKSEMETYLRYKSEASALADLIKTRESQSASLSDARKRKADFVATLENLRERATSPETRKAETKSKRRSILAKTGVVIVAAPAGVAGLIGIFSIGIALRDLESDNIGSNEGGWSFWGIGLGCFLILGICVAICGWLDRKSKQEKTVRQKSIAIESKIRKVEAEITELEPLVNAQLKEEESAKFQARDISQLLERKRERNEFMLDFQRTNELPSDGVVQRDTSNRISRREMSVEVQEMARRSDKKIAAIILYREQTGATLSEAKAAVEAFAMGNQK